LSFVLDAICAHAGSANPSHMPHAATAIDIALLLIIARERQKLQIPHE